MFGGVLGKIHEAIRAIDNTQQVCFLLKLQIIDKLLIENNTDELLSSFAFYESNSHNSKPKHIEEAAITDSLADAAKAIIEKEKKAEPSIIDKSKLNALKEISKPKNDLIGTKLGMTGSQLGAKNKLESLIGKAKPKPTETTEEVNAAFLRMNERKKGMKESNFLSVIESAKENVTIDALTKKLENKFENQTKEDQNENSEKLAENISNINENLGNLSNREINEDKILDKLVKKKSSKLFNKI